MDDNRRFRPLFLGFWREKEKEEVSLGVKGRVLDQGSLL